MNAAHAAGQRWTLADLIDFETLLAGVDETALEHDRLIFNRDIRPDLPHGDERARRRAGLRAIFGPTVSKIIFAAAKIPNRSEIA